MGSGWIGWSSRVSECGCSSGKHSLKNVRASAGMSNSLVQEGLEQASPSRMVATNVKVPHGQRTFTIVPDSGL